jgi:hypothetical protein
LSENKKAKQSVNKNGNASPSIYKKLADRRANYAYNVPARPGFLAPGSVWRLISYEELLKVMYVYRILAIKPYP